MFARSAFDLPVDRNFFLGRLTSSGGGYGSPRCGSERRSQARLLHAEARRLGEFDQAAEAAAFLGLVVGENFGETMIEKWI